jgi:hypothetical protein
LKSPPYGEIQRPEEGHMGRVWGAATIGLLAAILSASVIARDDWYDFDRQADFSGLRTYSFKEGTKSGDRFVDERIERAIVHNLSRLGMTRDDRNPDVFIVTHLTFEKEKDIRSYSTYPGYGPYDWYWGTGWGVSEIRVREITMGTLLIDVIDAERGAVIWRGGAIERVKHRSPESADEHIQDTVDEILENFPPGRDNQ